MFQTLANSVRAELRKEGQDTGVDQSSEQSSEASMSVLLFGYQRESATMRAVRKTRKGTWAA